jgi:site-specific DNA-methyltransferase (adenine-specific)
MIDLRQGNCLDIMKSLPDGCIDAIITDPPYGTTACKWDSVIPFEPMWEQLKRIIKTNGAIVLFGSEPFSSALRISNIKQYKYDWVWEKSPFNFLNSSHQPLRNSENISVFYKQKCNYYPVEKDLISYKTHGLKFKQTDTVGNYNFQYKEKNGYAKPTTIIKGIKKEDTRLIKHPTQKPVALLEYLIKTYTNENETVLDFTMGSGTTGVACKNLNRNFIGIELDETYFNIAKERIGD